MDLDLYERVKNAAKSKKVSINKMEQDLGFARSYISKFRNITPSGDVLNKIADYLDVPIEYLVEDKGLVRCKECGMEYYSPDVDECRLHEMNHKAWQKAVLVFGFCWPYSLREKNKAAARNKLASGSLALEEKIEANIEVFKALFSRSLEANNYDLHHVYFREYVSMLLYQEQFKKNIDIETYSELVAEYGAKEGIEEGTTYYIVPETPSIQTVAAHKENNEDWTSDELKKIEEYKKLLLRARNSQG